LSRTDGTSGGNVEGQRPRTTTPRDEDPDTGALPSDEDPVGGPTAVVGVVVPFGWSQDATMQWSLPLAHADAETTSARPTPNLNARLHVTRV
jgi:hypothetical protein